MKDLNPNRVAFRLQARVYHKTKMTLNFIVWFYRLFFLQQFQITNSAHGHITRFTVTWSIMFFIILIGTELQFNATEQF